MLSYKYSLGNNLGAENKYKTEHLKSFGLIQPENDPGLVAGTYGEEEASAEQIAQFDSDAKDRASFNSNNHLPKGLFEPEGQKFDSNKQNLVINFTEDNYNTLLDTLHGLNQYFKLDIGDAAKIKERFNVLIGWSTSLEDAVKVFKLIKDKVGDWSKTFTLFLNDITINSGTGPNFDFTGYGDNDKGFFIPDTIQRLLGLPVGTSRTIYRAQAQSRQQVKFDLFTPNWRKYNEEQTRTAIDQMSETFKKIPDGFNIDTELIKGNNAGGEKYNGLRIPIEAFIKSLGI